MASAPKIDKLLETVPYAVLARIVARVSAGLSTLDHEAAKLKTEHNVLRRAIRTIPDLETAYLRSRSASGPGRPPARTTSVGVLRSVQARVARGEVNVTEAARRLGLSGRTLYDRLADLKRRDRLADPV